MRQEISDQIIRDMKHLEENSPLCFLTLDGRHLDGKFDIMEDLVGYNDITYVDVKERSLITAKNGSKFISTIPTMSFVWDEFLAKHLDMVADDGN